MAKQTFTTGQVLTAAQMTSLQQTAMGGGSTTAKTTSYVLTAADAGTVVQMNAAGATTITVNTGLFAAGDTVQIQNIGAGVCTITAGTATVNTAGSLALSQYEGGQLYFNSTGAAIFFDVVQSSSASGMTLISRQSFSNVAGTGTTFDGIFTSTYKTYLVIIENIAGVTFSDDLQMQFRYAGPTTQAASYYGSSIYTDYSTATVANLGTNNGAQATLSTAIGTSGAGDSTGYIWVQDVGNSSYIPRYQGSVVCQDSSTINYFGGFTNTARVYTGLLFKSSSTNVTGTIAVYGLAAA